VPRRQRAARPTTQGAEVALGEVAHVITEISSSQSVIAAAVAFIPDDYSYVLPHTGAATLGSLLLLALLLGVFRHARDASLASAVLLGSLVGLLALTKPEPAAAGVVAVTALLPIALPAAIGVLASIILRRTAAAFSTGDERHAR